MRPKASENTAIRRAGLRIMVAWIAMVLAAVLPIIVLSLVAYRVTSVSVRALVRANNHSAAKMAAQLVHDEIEVSINLAKGLAKMSGMVTAVQRHDEDDVRDWLDAALQAFPNVDRAQVFDTQGLLWADCPRATESLGKNFAYRDYFRGLSQNWQPYVSEVFQRMAEPRRIVVGIAVPIRDRNQRVLGGIVLQLRLEEVTQWVKQIGVGEHGYVFLIDHNGHVAAHPKLDLQTRYYEEYASLAPVKAALEGQESTIEYRDPLAQQSMVATFAAVPLAGQRWVVVAQQDRDEAYLPIKRVGWQLGLSGGILAVGAVAVLLVLGRIRQKLQRTNRSLKQLLEVYERHRQLVAFEIHDALAQPLTAAIMNFEALKSASIQGTAAGQDRFDAALELLRDSLAETRRLMSGLRPPILDDFGVLAAVGYLVRESQLATGVEIEWSHQVTFRRLAPPLEITLYRIIHEGLTNALRHSKSERIGIRLTQTGEQIHLVIEDSGCGFNRQQVAASRFGIRGICERAESSGGSAIIDSGPGRGTRVIVELPLVEASEEAQMVEEA